METLSRSFELHRGFRGFHLVSPGDCYFVPWNKALGFLEKLQTEDQDTLQESVLTILSNYDPDSEFLALVQKGNTLSVELYSSVK